jgi:hypothetical protein
MDACESSPDEMTEPDDAPGSAGKSSWDIVNSLESDTG